MEVCLSLIVVSLICLIKNSHPLMMSMNLLVLSTFVGFYFYSIAYKWVFIVVLLTYLGGIMILFIYVSMLSMEDKLTGKVGPLAALVVLAALYSVSWFKFGSGHQSLLSQSGMLKISEMYALSGLPLLLFLLTYLLLGLFAVVKMSESFKGTMVKSLLS